MMAALGWAAVAQGQPARQTQVEGVQQSAAAAQAKADLYRVTYVKLGSDRKEGLLYEPVTPGPQTRIGVVFTFPRATFDAVPAAELASRGYRVLWVTPYSEDETPYDGLAETSAAIDYVRSLPGIERVVAMSHSGGGRMMAFYAALAEKGAAVCNGPGQIYPCRAEKVTGLAKPDGVVLLDSAPGAFNTASAVDPAYVGAMRSRGDVDMYAPANGYDPKTGAAHYSAAFQKRFYAAQSARNNAIVARAVARLKLIEAGKGPYRGDEPFAVIGAVNGGNAASLYHTDLSLLSRTKAAHRLLKADGTTPEVIIHSVRAATGAVNIKSLGTLCCDALNYSVKAFLSNDAIRTTPDFAVTEDDIRGVDWHSGLRSTPASAESITVPTLILSMSCFHFVTVDEIIYDHLAARDKTYASVEGATHNFTPCRKEYGDTQTRTFDFVARWLAQPGRF